VIVSSSNCALCSCGRMWSNLPGALLRQILLRNNRVCDWVNARHVCKAWNASLCQDAASLQTLLLHFSSEDAELVRFRGISWERRLEQLRILEKRMFDQAGSYFRVTTHKMVDASLGLAATVRGEPVVRTGCVENSFVHWPLENTQLCARVVILPRVNQVWVQQSLDKMLRFDTSTGQVLGDFQVCEAEVDLRLMLPVKSLRGEQLLCAASLPLRKDLVLFDVDGCVTRRIQVNSDESLTAPLSWYSAIVDLDQDRLVLLDLYSKACDVRRLSTGHSLVSLEAKSELQQVKSTVILDSDISDRLSAWGDVYEEDVHDREQRVTLTFSMLLSDSTQQRLCAMGHELQAGMDSSVDNGGTSGCASVTTASLDTSGSWSNYGTVPSRQHDAVGCGGIRLCERVFVVASEGRGHTLVSDATDPQLSIAHLLLGKVRKVPLPKWVSKVRAVHFNAERVLLIVTKDVSWRRRRAEWHLVHVDFPAKD
jgi:hypothetical protein